MVATRRGVRVYSPDRTRTEESLVDLGATPAGARRTRRTAAKEETLSHSELTSDSPHEDGGPSAIPSVQSSAVKRKSRASTRTRGTVLPDSTNEADVSESESCCSALSIAEALPDARVTRSGRRRALPRQKPSSKREGDEVSEAESACSSVSATRGSVPRTERRRKRSRPVSDGPSKLTSEDNENSAVESCSSVVSGAKAEGSQRVTRSQRRNDLSRASSKSRTEDTEFSEPDSCSSSISGLRNSTVRRMTRARKSQVVQPIPICLEEDPETSAPPASSRRTCSGRVKPGSASEPQSQDSEGFESGPSRTPRRSKRNKTVIVQSDSESELADSHSPLGGVSSARERGTPCSSRTGSVTISLTRVADESLSVVVESETPGSFTASGPTRKEASDVSVGFSSRSAKVIVYEAEETEGLDADEGFAVDSYADPECCFVVESEQDKTLTAEDVACETTQEMAGAPTQTIKVTVFDSVDTNRKEPDEIVDDDVALKSQDSREHTAEGAASTPVLTAEVPEQVKRPGVPEGESRETATVVVSESDLGQEEGSETMEVDFTAPSTGGVKEMDAALVEISGGVCPAVNEVYQDKGSCLVKKPDVFCLLISSEEEEELNVDSEDSVGVSGSEKDSSGSDGEGEIVCVTDSHAGPSKPTAKSPSVLDDGLFVIDTRPGLQTDGKYYLDDAVRSEEKETDEKMSEVEEDDDEFVDEEEDDDEEAEVLFKSRNSAVAELSSSIDPGLKVKEMGGLYISFDGNKSKGVSDTLKKLKEQKNQDELLKKSVMGHDFEKKDCVPPYKESKQKMKLKRKEEREKTTGDGWFNMKAPEMTEELKNDLNTLKMRSAMDPKRFYKKNDRDGFPKYFQVGTVMDNPVDFYHSRMPKKLRKRTMVEELLADAEFRNYNKKKYKQIMAERAARAAGKKNRKNNKSHKKREVPLK